MRGFHVTFGPLFDTYFVDMDMTRLVIRMQTAYWIFEQIKAPCFY